MEKLTLDELAIRAKAGDEDALRLIYAESRDMLKSKANLYYMVGADRDDVIQEGMIGLFNAIRTFDPSVGASFKAFSELCVKRRIINAVKMAGRKKHGPLNESVPIDTTPEVDELDAAADPGEIVLLADFLSYVESNAQVLFSELERTVWESYARGNNASAIAKKLEKSPKSIENALTRIKSKIEKLISMY